jgi:hypothetical protein
MPVSWKALLDAFEFANLGGMGEHQAFVCRQTGKIYERSELLDEDDQEQLPDDLEDNPNYLVIPDKRELDLGKPLVLGFAREFLPNDFDEVRRIFSRRGAYAAFKSLLVRKHALDRWYDFESKATEKALRDWCEVNSIELTE